MRGRFALLVTLLAIALAAVGGAIVYVVVREPARPVAPAADAPAAPQQTPHKSGDF